MGRIVYRNHEYHLSEDEVMFEVHEFVRNREIISDACAQTIASWWHSPASSNSTALSTMGAVTDDMCISDFAGQNEYDMADKETKQSLRAIDAYVKDRQKGHN